MLNYQRVCFVGSRVPWSSHIGGSPWFTAKELLSSDRVIRRPAILEEEEAQAIKAAGKLRDEVSNGSRQKRHCVHIYLGMMYGYKIWQNDIEVTSYTYVKYVCGRNRFRCCFLPVALVSVSPLAEVDVGVVPWVQVCPVLGWQRNASELAKPHPNIGKNHMLHMHTACITLLHTHM